MPPQRPARAWRRRSGPVLRDPNSIGDSGPRAARVDAEFRADTMIARFAALYEQLARAERAIGLIDRIGQSAEIVGVPQDPSASDTRGPWAGGNRVVRAQFRREQSGRNRHVARRGIAGGGLLVAGHPPLLGTTRVRAFGMAPRNGMRGRVTAQDAVVLFSTG